jgi:hypothetical protein
MLNLAPMQALATKGYVPPSIKNFDVELFLKTA